MKYRDLPLFKRACISVAVGVAAIVGKLGRQEGRFVDVERYRDKYHDYYLTKIELVGRSGLHPRQQYLLNNDVHFGQRGQYIVGTAVRVMEDGTLKQRQFFFNDQHIKEIGLNAPTLRKPIGDGTSVICDKRLMICCVGQNLVGVAPNFFMRTQYVDYTQGSAQEIKKIHKLLQQPAKVRKKMDLHYQS